MPEEKMQIIEKSAEEYRNLPPEKKMYVMGIMQGIMMSKQTEEENNEELQEAR